MQQFAVVTESYSDGDSSFSLSQQNVTSEERDVTILARWYVTYKIGECSFLSLFTFTSSLDMFSILPVQLY